MPSSGDDPNQWYLGNETTMDGCHGSKGSASASSINSSTNPAKPPASDKQPSAEDQNATMDPGGRTTRNQRCNSQAQNDNQNNFQGLNCQVFNSGQYSFSPRGNHSGSFSEQNVPRSMCEEALKAAFRKNIVNDRPQVQPRGALAQIRPESMGPHQGTNDPMESRNQPRPRLKNIGATKQNAREAKNPAAEHREFDKNEDPREDAETDEEPSPSLMDGKGCRQN